MLEINDASTFKSKVESNKSQAVSECTQQIKTRCNQPSAVQQRPAEFRQLLSAIVSSGLAQAALPVIC